MNPKYIFVSGTTFYLLHELPADEDYCHGSYAAMHCDAFGHVQGEPCGRGAGGSYAPTEVDRLYRQVTQ